MPIDLTRITYEVKLITEKGATIDLSQMLLMVSWEEHDGEMAQKATIKLRNAKVETDTYLITYVKLNSIILIYANWGNGKTLVFKGNVWDWVYSSAQTKELTVTAYDPLIRLQKCEDYKYYEKGMDTKAIIADICSSWSIPMNYEWDTITHEKKSFKPQALSDMIISLLNEVKRQKGNEYVMYYNYTDNQLNIASRGTNKDIYYFTYDNVISTSDSRTMNNLVTKVKIFGQESKDKRAPFEDHVDGRLEFGVLQKVIMRDSNKTLEQVKNEAQNIIKENSKPNKSISVVSPDLPFLRKGHKIKMAAGNLVEYFYVLGVSHDAAGSTMTMELVREEN